jgi:hypothetical protein
LSYTVMIVNIFSPVDGVKIEYISYIILVIG